MAARLMASPFTTAMYVMALLVFGVLNVVTRKMFLTMDGAAADGEERTFTKPWFITFAMSLSMSSALLLDRGMFKTLPRQDTLLDDAAGGGILSLMSKVKLVALPGIFDIVAAGLNTMGLFYIPMSVQQLLRGAEIVFVALFSVIFLGRELWFFHWVGILLCTSSMIAVALANIWGAPEASEVDASTGGSIGTLICGMALVFAGQVVLAIQNVLEEWLIKDVGMTGIQIIGFQGLWGTLVMVVMVFPMLFYLPGQDQGHFEDDLEAVSMVWSTLSLRIMMLAHMFICVVYNLTSITVTGALSAVRKGMLNALRTSIIWGFSLAVHYLFDPGSKFGEAWTSWSWLQLCGFANLILAQAVYGQFIRVPGLAYPESDSDDESDGGTVADDADAE